MPELPEVETIVRQLREPLVGRRFTSFHARWKNSIKSPIPFIQKQLPGARIESIVRRGKYLRFNLSSGLTMFIHLKMSGDLLVEPAGPTETKHIRTTFGLDNGFELRFKDPRKFGRVYLVQNPNDVVGTLGPEPLERSFTLEKFIVLCSARKGRLKSLLLNQQFIAGLGNIYVDESCFVAKLSPLRNVSTLSTKQMESLYKAIRSVLTNAIKNKGSTFDLVYRGGQYQDKFKVYGRGGERCKRAGCRGVIKRIEVGTRSTHFCPRCQK